MYSVYADGVCIYNDAFALDNMKLASPKLTLEDNAAGSFVMTVPPSNLGYSTIIRIRIGAPTRMCLMCSPPVVRNSVFSATRTVDGFTSMPIIFVPAPSMPIISTCRVIMVDSAKGMALTVSIRPTVR